MTELSRRVANVLFVPLIVLALAVMVKGHDGVGDGFAAGMIAALGVVVQYLVLGHEEVERRLPVRHAAVLALGGLLLALALAAVPLAAGESLLTHAPPPGSEPVELGSLKLITSVLFDAAIFLLIIGVVVAVVRGLLAPVVDGEEKA